MKKMLLLSIVFYWACTDASEQITEFDAGYGYLPVLEEGVTLLYEVDRVTYSNEGRDVIRESYFQREEVIVSEKNEDLSGEMRLDIFTSKNGGEPWTYEGAHSYDIDQLQSIHTNSEGERLINLTFPISENKTWDGLAFIGGNIQKNISGYMMNFYEGWESEIIRTSEPFGEYNDVITVSMADHENAIQRRKVTEYYAQDIGLLYQEMIILDTQCITECSDMAWEDKAHNGIIFNKRLISIQ